MNETRTDDAPRQRRRGRPLGAALPLALTLLGVITLGANPALGTAFIAAAIAAAASAATLVVVRRRRG